MTTRNEVIRLTGDTMYNPKFPPRNAKKGYVARITAKLRGKLGYEREFLGTEHLAMEGEEGLYERQKGLKKGGYTRWYHVVLCHPEHGMIMSRDCEDMAPRIAKMLGDGHKIEDIVEVNDLRPSENVEGRMVFDASVRTVSNARKQDNPLAGFSSDQLVKELERRGLSVSFE